MTQQTDRVCEVVVGVDGSDEAARATGTAAVLFETAVRYGHPAESLPCPVAVVRPPRDRGPGPAPGRTAG